MTDRDVHNFWESLGSRYQHASTADQNDRRGHKNTYISLLRDYYVLRELAPLPKGAVVLDFGCGEGGLTRTLADAGYYVVGLDIALSLLELAVQQDGRNRLAYVRYDGRSLPIASNSCDAIVVFGVMMYLGDELLMDVLLEMKRILRPEASLVMIEQSRKNTRAIGSYRKTQRARQAWLAAMHGAGFKVAHTEICRHGHFPLTYLIRYGLWPMRWWRTAMQAENWFGRLFGFIPNDYADILFVAKVRA